MQTLASLGGASRGMLLVRDTAPDSQWRQLADWPTSFPTTRITQAFQASLIQLADTTVQQGQSILPLDSPVPRGPGQFAAAVRLQLTSGPHCVAALLFSEVTESSLHETLLRLRLAVDVPLSFQDHQSAQKARDDASSFASALDVMVMVNEEKRFLAAALAFCNAAASRFQCDRISLGWFEGGYIKLRAMSRTEKFNRQMAAAQLLETAMDEALDQDDEILWPPPKDSTLVTRDHEAFAQDQSVACLLSLPIRLDGKIVAVLTCERAEPAFKEAEIQQLRLCCDQAARRLTDLKTTDRWFGARLAAAFKEKAATWLGPKNTWAKVGAIAGCIVLAALFLIRPVYRAEGNFILRSDEGAFLTAPFDGFIDQVDVRPGDKVEAGQRLLSLATRDLELEESAANADLNRYLREAEKARASRSLAEMRISESLADQARARLELVKYRLNQSAIKAPFKGVVVEGDLRERLAAPVKQGDALMRVAKAELLYVEAEIPEREIHEILGRDTGEIAFVSQPKHKFPIKILKVEPAAFPRAEGNVFLVRCAFINPPEDWWRPGMSGVCKLTVERRSLFWIFTHRTVDFLRLKLWW
ncbi:MAG: HlyD family efflux transporter periplasmic adaptor subunit [Verrucomicrobia bacterium]|nr:HlyD family efflux transporter periplasmic adaptor subunit [Verrucomicrobiota bacterium]